MNSVSLPIEGAALRYAETYGWRVIFRVSQTETETEITLRYIDRILDFKTDTVNKTVEKLLNIVKPQNKTT